MKRWIFGGLGLAAALVAAVVIYALATALRPERPVGFQLVGVRDGDGPPLPVALWYPADGASPRPMLLGPTVQFVARDAAPTGDALPLVVISHGTGGGPGSHVDTALALASAGYVVAAPMHAGDNFQDQSAVATPRWLVDRTRHVSRTLDHLLERWPDHARIDRARIGVFGFSAGAFTALAAIGGAPDFSLVADHCARQPEFVCELWPPSDAAFPAADAFARDPRIRAAVVAAPGYGFTFAQGGLASVDVPVQLWTGMADTIVPTASNARIVHAALGDRAELHAVPGAQHLSFLVPCGPIGPPALCADADGFDRRAFHAAFNAGIVGFFGRTLGATDAESGS